MTRIISVRSQRASKIFAWQDGKRDMDYHAVYEKIAKGERGQGNDEQAEIIRKLRDLEAALEEIRR